MIQLIQALLPIASSVIDRVVPDKEAAEKAKREIQLELVNNINEIAKAQIEVNKQEAAHRNVFVAGWRPFIGWICGAAFAYHFVLQPICVFALAAYGVSLDLPSFDMGALMTVLTGMLGLGGLRTFEKMKGTAK